MKMKWTKQVTAAALLATMVLSGSAVYADSGEQPVSATAQLISAQYNENDYFVVVDEKVLATAAYLKGEQLMVPLRETAEALGFKVTWVQDKQWAEVLLEGTPIWTLVQPNLDQYAYNRMNVQLGAAPVKLANRLYVPAQFFSEILRGNVSYEGKQVRISMQADEVKMQTQQAVITKINNEDNYKSIQANGVGVDGIIFNINEDTIIRNAAGEQVELSDLTLGLQIEVKHSLAMTMSLPGQTYAYEITALEEAGQLGLLGTAGNIQEVRTDDNGKISIVVEGSGMDQLSQEKIVLNINEDTRLVDLEGNAVEPAKLTKDARVLAYYGPMLAKSLPPIGQAWKIVYLGE